MSLSEKMTLQMLELYSIHVSIEMLKSIKWIALYILNLEILNISKYYFSYKIPTELRSKWLGTRRSI